MRATHLLSRINNRKILALLLAGGCGTRLQGLTANRAKPAVPFGGHHRIVDYTLSNCVNSGIPTVAVLTQYKSDSLVSHLQQNWLKPGASGSTEIEVWPAHQCAGSRGYLGTADAVYQNWSLIDRIDPDDILIVAGDQVYEMDYANLASAHARACADLTISSIEVPASQCREFGVIDVDAEQRLRGFVEKPQKSDGLELPNGKVLASMGIYMFSTDYLLYCLQADALDRESKHDFGHSILPRAVGDANVHVAPFRTRNGSPGYWRDVGTIDSYWRAHQEQLEGPVIGDGTGWSLRGSGPAGPPAQLAATATVRASSVGSACWIAGAVEKSIISKNCTVDRGTSIRESVLLPGVSVGRDCRLNRVIVDSDCRIPDNTVLDAGSLGTGGAFHISPDGVVLVTAEALNLPLERGERRSA
jgi:glucose-1-phosphate adenylyltransferase